MKSHGVYETPAGTVLLRAHRALESITLDKQVMHYKDLLASKYAELVYNGMWYTRLREALDAFVDVTQQQVSGTVRLKLYKGNLILAGRRSPTSLYREDYASFGERGRLRPEGCGRFHPPVRATAQGRGSAGYRA